MPRDLQQTLPTTPDLILNPPRSKRALNVPGALDRNHPVSHSLKMSRGIGVYCARNA